MLYRFILCLSLLAFCCLMPGAQATLAASGSEKTKEEAPSGGDKAKAASQKGEKEEESSSSEEEEGGNAKKKKENSEITGGETEGDPVYVHLKPVIFPIISDAGAEQIVTMLVDLRVKDFDAATNMSRYMPRMRDAVIQALYAGLADNSMRNKHMLDIPKVKDGIKNVANKVFGDGVVEEVLIQAVSQRKL